MGVGGQHPLGGQMTPQDVPGGFVVGDDRHIGGVALVAGTAVAQIVGARHQAASSTKTSGRTSSRGRSRDRQSVVKGKSVSVRVDLGVRRTIKKTITLCRSRTLQHNKTIQLTLLIDKSPTITS